MTVSRRTCFGFPHLECRRMPMPSATASAASSSSARRATSSSCVLARKTDGARTSSPTRNAFRCENSQPVPSHLLYRIDLDSILDVKRHRLFCRVSPFTSPSQKCARALSMADGTKTREQSTARGSLSFLLSSVGHVICPISSHRRQ